MAPQQKDLVKIGIEGFDLIDKFYGPPKKLSNNGGRQRQYNKEEIVINSKDAAYKYGGIMVVNYPKARPKNRWGNIFKAFKS
jgi:hypothetical protein